MNENMRRIIQKHASNYGGVGGALLGPVGAALGAEEGSGWRAAGGSAGGMLAGGLLGALTRNPALGALLATGGSAIGGHYGGAKKEPPKPEQPKEASLNTVEAAHVIGRLRAYEETGYTLKEAAEDMGLTEASVVEAVKAAAATYDPAQLCGALRACKEANLSFPEACASLGVSQSVATTLVTGVPW